MNWKRPMTSGTKPQFSMEKIKNDLPRNNGREIMLKVTREDVKEILEEMNDSDRENDEEVRKDRIDPKFTKSLRIYEPDKEVNLFEVLSKSKCLDV